MEKITKEQYEFAFAKKDFLMPLINDNTSANDKKALELSLVSDIVIVYEDAHYPIEKLTVSELINCR